MTRAEHLQWSKDRALGYARQGDLNQAIASMASDLSKHEELKDHSGIKLMTMLMLGGHLSTEDEVIRFIEGFN